MTGGRRMGLPHLNGDILCVVDVETSGDIPGFHDLLQICILPLDYKLDPWKDFSPFYMDIQPKRPENFDLAYPDLEIPNAHKLKRKTVAAANNGMEPFRAADMFDEWFAKFNLAWNKRIVPLAQNWPHDRGFVADWLGWLNFQSRFSAEYRDTMVTGLYLNDRANFKKEQHPFPFVNLRALSRKYEIVNPGAHDALSDCITTAQVYKQMMYEGV